MGADLALHNCRLPTSRFMVAGTSYTHHSQLFSKKNLWNEKAAKEPKSSQIAK